MRTAVSGLILSFLLSGCATGLVGSEVGRYTSDSNGFDTHSYFYDTGREVVVFDAQFTPAEAEKLLAAIRSQTKNPIRYLVLTHPNPDKFNGAPVFQREGAKVVASEATAAAIGAVHAYKKFYFVNVAKMFTEESYPAEARVDLTFKDRLALPLEGGAEVTLSVLQNPGVAVTQTVAHIPKRKALIVGDLVHHKAHAWLEGGIREGKATPDLERWKAALDELLAWPDTTVYGGRGESAPVQVAVEAQKQYLDGMKSLVQSYVEELGPRSSELCGNEAGPHYRVITQRASQAYPDHQLPYMVEFSVYGLATRLACP
jgi:glyoxylase-like metal-dependent hydrolase (beta-lactamase superfamily II)